MKNKDYILGIYTPKKDKFDPKHIEMLSKIYGKYFVKVFNDERFKDSLYVEIFDTAMVGYVSKNSVEDVSELLYNKLFKLINI